MTSWEITRKDLKLLVRDKRTVFALVVMPMLFITVIGLTFGQLLGWKNENQLYRIAVADLTDYDDYYSPDSEVDEQRLLAKTPINRVWAHNIVTAFIDRLQEQTGVMLKPAHDRAAALKLVDEGDANAALIIPPEFIENLRQMELEDLLPAEEAAATTAPAEGAAEEPAGSDLLRELGLELIHEDPGSTTETVMRTLVSGATLRTVVPYLACSADTESLAVAGGIRQRCDEVRAEATQPPVERVFEEKIPKASRRDIYQVLVPGYTVLFVFFLVHLMGHSFIHERDLGTMRRLRAAPVRHSSLLLGKTVPFFIVSIVQTFILFGFGRILFGMSWGKEPWLLLPVIVATSAAATCLGLLVATIVRTEAQVSAYANFIVILAGAISGCFMPRDWLPGPMKTISLITPHAWALEAYHEILRDPSPELAVVGESCVVLVVFAAAYFALGAWRFGKVE